MRQRVAAALRVNGIVDVEPYRKLGATSCGSECSRAIDPPTVQALTACIEWVVERPRAVSAAESPTAAVSA